jgi:hypothetical protein
MLKTCMFRLITFFSHLYSELLIISIGQNTPFFYFLIFILHLNNLLLLFKKKKIRTKSLSDGQPQCIPVGWCEQAPVKEELNVVRTFQDVSVLKMCVGSFVTV